VKRIGGIGEYCRTVGTRFRRMEVRMKDDLGSTASRPPHGFRISPAFMANHDTEGQRAGFEDLPKSARRIGSFFRRIDLDLVLKTGDRPIGMDDHRGRSQRVVNESLRAENHRDPGFCRRFTNDVRSTFEETGIGRRHAGSRSPVTWNEAFGKANDLRGFPRSLSDGRRSEANRLFGSLRKPDIGESDSNRVHNRVSLPLEFFQQCGRKSRNEPIITSITMPRTADHAIIRTILTAEPIWSAYALGDLAPGFFGDCDWHISADGTPALVMLYRGFETMVLFAVGDAPSIEPLIHEVEPAAKLYLHVKPEVLPLLKTKYEDCNAWAMWRMVLDRRRYHPVSAAHCARLRISDLSALQHLYSEGGPAGEAPDFFLPSMLSEGVYFGVFEGSELVAAAGTHMVIPEEGVGAIGNVYTRRDRRGRGHGAAVTGAVTNELLRLNLPTIVLNVNQRNGGALRLYERLGYERHCRYYEGLARQV
jgi:GNAT superfamily N-acetyltransferase